ncbi:unnamed protein product [Camellia sinensis]
MARHGIWHTGMQISALKYDPKQPRIMDTWHLMHEMNPKHKTRHMHWPIAIQNMHYLNMKCEDRFKEAPKQACLQF